MIHFNFNPFCYYKLRNIFFHNYSETNFKYSIIKAIIFYSYFSFVRWKKIETIPFEGN